jgi:hypothetical protein
VTSAMLPVPASNRAGVGGTYQRHVGDHVAAALPGRHVRQDLLPSVKDGRTVGSEHLVPGDHEEVRPQLPDVDRGVRHGLGDVHQHRGPRTVGQLGGPPDGSDCAQGEPG